MMETDEQALIRMLKDAGAELVDMTDKSDQIIKLELINTNLRRYTFESLKIKTWIENNSQGKCLNLFAGITKLDIDEIRNDIDINCIAEFHKDAVDFVKEWKGHKFDTIILDPPYAYRKAMEMYNGNYTSRFKMLADLIPTILKDNGRVISLGYHSTFLSKKRNAKLIKLCVFAHGGSQHCTIGIIEKIKIQHEDNTFICDICEKRKVNNPNDILNCAGIVICADCDKKNNSDRQ